MGLFPPGLGKFSAPQGPTSCAPGAPLIGQYCLLWGCENQQWPHPSATAVTKNEIPEYRQVHTNPTAGNNTIEGAPKSPQPPPPLLSDVAPTHGGRLSFGSVVNVSFTITITTPIISLARRRLARLIHHHHLQNKASTRNQAKPPASPPCLVRCRSQPGRLGSPSRVLLWTGWPRTTRRFARKRGSAFSVGSALRGAPHTGLREGSLASAPLFSSLCSRSPPPSLLLNRASR